MRAVRGYEPQTSKQYELFVSQTEVQHLLGGDAGLRGHTWRRRREIMEQIADLITLERRAGESHMATRAPQEDDVKFI